MKYSVSTYSYMSMIRNGEIAPFDCIAKTKELGFDAVEIVDFVNFDMDESLWEENAIKIKTEAERLGLEISSFTVKADFLNMDNEVERLKKMVDIASILGAKLMRHDATVGYPFDSDKYCSFDSVLDKLAKCFYEVAEYAETKGVMTMTENHGFFAQDSERIEKLYTAINHKNFGILCDMGNFMCADEDPAIAFSRLAPFAVYVHAKDFVLKDYYCDDPGEGSFQTRGGNYLRGTIIGHGNVPVKKCMYQLKKCGYDEYIAIEFEGMENAIDAIRIGVDNLRKYWSQI